MRNTKKYKVDLPKLKADDIPDDAFKELCAAICIQAAVDYKALLRGRGSCFKERLDEPEVYEAFFRSEYFRYLSGFADGDKIIRHLKETKYEKTNVYDTGKRR